MKARLYIDGYNFYYAIKNNPALGIYLGWCNFRTLAESALSPQGFEVGKIKYFTAPVGFVQHETDERTRQSVWLQAQNTIRDLEVITGFYQPGGAEPPVRPDQIVKNREEKQTDVNIAVNMVLDAVDDTECDLFVLITSDTDQIPAIKAITDSKRVKKPRQVQVWFPPGRYSRRWAGISNSSIKCREITPEELDRVRLPDEIPCDYGVIKCPHIWRRPLNGG
ncbi:MAG: NYN domain-containing protein [bacterium]